MKWNYQKVSVATGVDVRSSPGQLTDLRFDDEGHYIPPGDHMNNAEVLELATSFPDADGAPWRDHHPRRRPSPPSC